MSQNEVVIKIKENRSPPRRVLNQNGRKIVCIADGSICSNVKHTGFFTWFNCCFKFMQDKEIPLFSNTLPQQLYEKLDESGGDLIKHYIPGCGSNGGLQSFYDLSTGWEVPHIFMKILTFLGNNYNGGDNNNNNDTIYLFGYSRGGYATSLVIRFLQFFSDHNEGRCLPNGLQVWNDVTPKKLVYDLTHGKEEELMKTFTRNHLRNNFKKLRIEDIKFVGLMDVVPMYWNQSYICDPFCYDCCIGPLLQIRGPDLPAETVFKDIQKVVHFVPKNKVNICCPFFDCIFELFPSSIITNNNGNQISSNNNNDPNSPLLNDKNHSSFNVDQYFLKNENHLKMSDNVDLIEIMNQEVIRSGLKLKNPLVSSDPSGRRDDIYMFYYFFPMFIQKEKIIKDKFISTTFQMNNSNNFYQEEEEEEEEEDQILNPLEDDE